MKYEIGATWRIIKMTPQECVVFTTVRTLVPQRSFLQLQRTIDSCAKILLTTAAQSKTLCEALCAKSPHEFVCEYVSMNACPGAWIACGAQLGKLQQSCRNHTVAEDCLIFSAMLILRHISRSRVTAGRMFAFALN